MARSGGCDEIWGTWEELLLASAVSRHGTKNWASVSVVVGERTSFPHLLTAEVCEQQYRDLCHRFQGEAYEIEAARDGPAVFVIPWLDELRKLRVAELRREVQRHDVSIVSLQSKVEKLKEERERSLREDDAGADAPDLEESNHKSNGNLPVANAAGERSGRSCNESNSPESKEEAHKRQPAGREKPRGQEEEAGTRSAKPDLATACEDKAAGEGSCNGSSETVVIGKGTEAVNAADDVGCRDPIPHPPESGESMAESTGEEAAKESSDVQSSASPSRRRKRGGRMTPTVASGGNSEGDSPEAEEVSPTTKEDLTGKSQPVVVLLEIIRSNKYGSIFERRLDSQDSTRYRSLIRQHMDLETIGKKLEDGSYTAIEFFRDLLLVCANAIVFFPKDSSEHKAATHLRKLVNKELAPFNMKPTSMRPPPPPPPPPPPDVTVSPPPASPAPPPPRPPPPPRQPQPTTSKPKSEPEPPTSLLDKVLPTPPLSACRKRSSLSAKTASATVKAAKEDVSPADVKSNMNKELESAEKKDIKEKLVARGLRTTKTRAAMTRKPNLTSSDTNPKPEPEPKEKSTTEPVKASMEKNSNNNVGSGGMDVPLPVAVAKKRSAASFLNRLKGTAALPSSNNGERVQAGKNVETGNGTRPGGGSGEQKKGAKEDRRKEKQEPSGPVKRSVGRPPKRPPPTLPSQLPAKRAREAEVEASHEPPPSTAAVGKKRGRR